VTTPKLMTLISRNNAIVTKLGYSLFWLALFVATLVAGPKAEAAVNPDACKAGAITAHVVVLDNPTVFNRLGAQNPNWITYALKRDVIAVDSVTRLPTGDAAGTKLTAGNVELRPDKRPRPLVIRSVAGSCLTIEFTNLLAPVANPNNAQQDNLFNDDQVKGRCAGFHATGTELVDSILDDGSMVGDIAGDTINNCAAGDVKGSLVGPGKSITYNLYTPHEGAFIINSYGATLGSEASSGNLAVGMFGALNVEPVGSSIYRSQVTEEELRLATVGLVPTDCTGDMGEVSGVDCNPGGQPIIDYEAVYPNVAPWIAEGKAGLPILNMLTAADELVHSDINAIIAGPNDDGSFPISTYPLESVGKNNPQLPNRLQPFREFTSVFHDEQTNSQVFPKWYNNPVLQYTLAGVKDQFMINYGSGGIGSEIIANRLHAGPMHDCADCAYEEFFLASQTVGDPAMLVNFPANTGIEQCDPTQILVFDGGNDGIVGDDPATQVDEGADDVPAVNQPCWRDAVNGANPPIPGNYALFQEDPSNVHHAYTGDFTKIRNIHAGSFEQHIFHLHNHQWMFNPNDDNANYLDAQEIMPGSGHTYELVNGGAGNRNKTVGDAIFHCHFYPHFAQGMWYHIRNHDVLETGSLLAVSTPIDTNGDDLPDAGDIDGDGFHDKAWELRSGRPAAGARALPDGELPDGSPIPAIVPLPGRAMPQMPANVSVAAVDRGDFGVLSGRRPPNGLGQGPDSSQAIVDFTSVAGPDGIVGDDPATLLVDEGADDVSPGFPFWLSGNSCGEGAGVDTLTGLMVCPEGIVGQRMPTPVLDMLTEAGASAVGFNPKQAGGWDGGLPRHSLLGYTAGALSLDTQSRLDFRKVLKAAQPVYFPETGTVLEKVSMNYQAVRFRPSVANALAGTATTAADFVLNGAAPVPGGPYNDPCIDDMGRNVKVWSDEDEDGEADYPIAWLNGDGDEYSYNTAGRPNVHDGDNPRTYKIANVQIDAVFNKVGHHYSQERIIALWDDVAPTINKQRPPEPLVMRFNTFDCGKILHSNLVPAEFEVDDFQVRTPTDIIGQHIHLPKWDLTTGDGAANGWNYEDGAMAPLMVQERIKAINNYNLLAQLQKDGVPIPTSSNVVPTLPEILGLLGVTVNPILGNAVAGHLVDLTGLDPVPTIDTGDEGSTVVAGAVELHAQPHPFFGTGNMVNGHYEYKGARTVIQRILVDPVLNVANEDRGLGLTFSHDHYGPSSFQQIGLYSTILAEPAGSTWYHNESGEPLYGRQITMADGSSGGTDGGPTTWQAVIDTADGSNVPDHREFYFEMSDFQHAYEAGVYVGAGPDGRPLMEEVAGQIHEVVQPDPFDVTRATAPNIQDKWQNAINPPLKLEAHVFPDVVTAHGACPGDTIPGPAIGQPTNFDPDVPRPCAEAINISHSSMWVVNYRNEPVGLRVFDPSKKGPDGENGSQADGQPGDLALAFQSRGDRAISELNTRFGNTPYPEATYCSGKGDGINCDRRNGDPFTPIMRTYENDQVKIKIQVGATEEQHQTTVHGIKWLSNGSGFGRSPNSGWRNFQSHGISEQFSLQVPIIPDRNQRANAVDYLYAQDATRDGIWMGTWGILRSYGSGQSDLFELPDNSQNGSIAFSNDGDFSGVCPNYQTDANGDPIRDPNGKGKNPYLAVDTKEFTVYAVLANDVLPNNLGVTIPQLTDIDESRLAVTQTYGQGTVGGPLNPDGGTLVYNRRGTFVPDVVVPAEGAEPAQTFTGGSGPLNDPTAIMYVREEDLEHRFIEGISPDVKPAGGDGIDDRCETIKYKKNGTVQSANINIWTKGCPVKIRDDAPVEPLVLRANAGDCIEVTVHNKLLEQAVDKNAAKDGDGIYIEDPRIFSCDGDDGYGYCSSPLGVEIFDDVLAYAQMNGGKVLARTDGKIVAYNEEDAKTNVLFDTMPDLAGWQDMMWAVTRRIQGADVNAEMHFFNNNLIRPSSLAGLHAQLVEYDASRDDGVVVGVNPQSQVARPAGQHTYRYYAGDISAVPDGTSTKGNKTTRKFRRVATPVEFGASNLLSADRIKQPQKGMFGALVIEPQGATVDETTLVADGQGLEVDGETSPTRLTRAQVSVTAPVGDAGSGGTYREGLAIGHKITNLRWKDGSAIKNIHQGELGREGAEDSGHAGFNYGMEPSWFRFQLPPNVPFGNAQSLDGTAFGSIPNVHALYANGLVAGEPNAIPAIAGVSALGDPQTPVFRTTVDPSNPVTDTRMYVLNGASADRDGTFILHGHVWQRDPYVCPGQARVGLTGLCEMDSVGALALGLNPIGKYMGGEEGMGHVFGHWPILFDAGGTFGVTGDYLYRDYTPSGNRNGMFGILRVEEE